LLSELFVYAVKSSVLVSVLLEHKLALYVLKYMAVSLRYWRFSSIIV